MPNSREILRLNVGFIASQNVGYTREFEFDIPYLEIPPDLDLFDLTGTAAGTKTARGVLLQGQMDAVMTLQCSRCLEDYAHSIGIEFAELYAFDPRKLDESAQKLPDNGVIDLGPLVREEMLVSVPINPHCSDDCLGLCPICGGNLNETRCHHDEIDIDPRLEVLRSYLGEDLDSPSDK